MYREPERLYIALAAFCPTYSCFNEKRDSCCLNIDLRETTANERTKTATLNFTRTFYNLIILNKNKKRWTNICVVLTGVAVILRVSYRLVMSPSSSHTYRLGELHLHAHVIILFFYIIHSISYNLIQKHSNSSSIDLFSWYALWTRHRWYTCYCLKGDNSY